MSQFDTFLFDTALFDDPGTPPGPYTGQITYRGDWTASLDLAGAPLESAPPQISR